MLLFKIKAYLKLWACLLISLPVLYIFRGLQFLHRNVNNVKVATFVREKMARPIEDSKAMESFVTWGLEDYDKLDRM